MCRYRWKNVDGHESEKKNEKLEMKRNFSFRCFFFGKGPQNTLIGID